MLVAPRPSADFQAASRVPTASSAATASSPLGGVSSGSLANCNYASRSMGTSSVVTASLPLSALSSALSGSPETQIVLESPTIPPTTPDHTVAIAPLVATPIQTQQSVTEYGPISKRPLACSQSRSFPSGGLFLPELQPPPSATISTAAAGGSRQVAPCRRQQEELSEEDSNYADVDYSKSNSSDGTKSADVNSTCSFDSSEPSLSLPVPGRVCSTQPRPCALQTSPPPLHSIFSALVMADSSRVPVASAVASFSARCQKATAELRCPRDVRCWLHAALAIGILSSMCCVSAAQGAWSTAQLSVARCDFAATSVGNVAIFAGGSVTSGRKSSFALCVEWLLMGLLCVGYVWSRLVAGCCLCLRSSLLPSHDGHYR